MSNEKAPTLDKKVLLVIMDGIGVSKTGIGDSTKIANTPQLNALKDKYLYTELKAHGKEVGLPSDDDMGNSEVGHNALGCGQIYNQGAKLVNESIDSGELFQTHTWNNIIRNCKENSSSLHFIGLLSDGRVHADMAHLFAMLEEARREEIKRVRIHTLLDGRDVPPRSALTYIRLLEDKLQELRTPNFDYKIGSGGGRMAITMDRYQANWDMVRLGYETHVLGMGRQFLSAEDAIVTYRQELDVKDQDLPPFVIGEQGNSIGKIQSKDSVILFNFRGDRAMELSMVLEQEQFHGFNRLEKTEIEFAGMLQYDGDLKIPTKYLVDPPKIKNTLTELLVKHEIHQYAISETQKYGHVTYFWNGNKSGKFSEELETYCEILSDTLPFEQRPWMKCSQITDKLIEAIESNTYGFIRCNYPNGDMVGHTGDIAAAAIAVSTVDLQIARLIPICDRCGYTLVITADHGNAEEMLEIDKAGNKQMKTAHSLNKVPFILCDKNNKYTIKEGEYGLSNVAATIATLLGLPIPSQWKESIIE